MAFGTTNKLNIMDLLKKINNDDIKINLNSEDIFYN